MVVRIKANRLIPQMDKMTGAIAMLKGDIIAMARKEVEVVIISTVEETIIWDYLLLKELHKNLEKLIVLQVMQM